jgi:hypothetical protein
MRRLERGELNKRMTVLLIGGEKDRLDLPFGRGGRTSFVKLFSQVFVLALFLVGIPGLRAAGDPSDILLEEGVVIRVEDTETRIGIAKVRLQISPLKIENDRVTGKYRIRVPLLSSKNDDGLIDLEFRQELPVTFQKGGVLEGDGISTTFTEDPPRGIICEILPDAASKLAGDIVLIIETTDRTIRFKSRYSVVENVLPGSRIAGDLAKWRSE